MREEKKRKKQNLSASSVEFVESDLAISLAPSPPILLF